MGLVIWAITELPRPPGTGGFIAPPPKSGFPISSRRMRRPGFIPICAAHLFVHKVRFDAMEGCKTSAIFLYIQCVSLENSLGKMEKWGEP